MRGFYGIVDSPESPAAAAILAEKLVSGGATAVQVRMKGAATRDLLAVARAVRDVVRGDILFVVNDRVDVALLAGADAVHLGQDDLSLEDARRIAGGRLVIGVSTHNLEQARAAAGADYLGFGPVFATATKENPDPVQGLAALAQVVRTVAPVPVVAIGGITIDNVADVAGTGAAAACAIAAVSRAADPAAAARSMAAAFRRVP